MKSAKIQNYMTKNVITVKDTDDIIFAMSALISNKISAVPVLNNEGDLVGVLSEKCCLEIAISSAINEVCGGEVSHVMSTDLHIMNQHESIFDAAKAFKEKPNRSFPVIDEHKRLVGVISARDVLRALQDII